MSWFKDALRKVGDVALDIGKVVGTVVTPFNPLLGMAIGGGALLLDRATNWEGKSSPVSSPITGGLVGGPVQSYTPGILPPAVQANIPGGNILDIALSGMFGGSAQAAGGALTVAPGTTSGPGFLPRGPGGALQMPWSDPRIPQFLKQFAIDDAYLRVVPRAPAGYVVLRDASGRPFGVLKQIAKAFKLWKPKQKPPISVKDWNALKRGCSTVRKMQRVAKMANALGKRKRLAIC